jgi:hypothetical protein
MKEMRIDELGRIKLTPSKVVLVLLLVIAGTAALTYACTLWAPEAEGACTRLPYALLRLFS